MHFIGLHYFISVPGRNHSCYQALFLLGMSFIFGGCKNSSEESSENHSTWESYLGGPGRNHFSNLDQITPHNVSQLEIAWTYKAPDSGQMQMNPIIANGMVYGMTAAVQTIALNAETGKEI